MEHLRWCDLPIAQYRDSVTVNNFPSRPHGRRSLVQLINSTQEAGYDEQK
jgi:hypothetical protein